MNLYDDLNSRGMNITPFRFNRASRKDLLTNLQILLDQDRIKIPDDEVLLDELRSMTYELNEAGNTVIKVPDGKHDDRIMSLALAVWDIPERPLNVTPFSNVGEPAGGVDSFYPEIGF